MATVDRWRSETASPRERAVQLLPSSTLEQMLGAQAARLGDSSALLAPGRGSLTFARLQEHIRKTRLRLWQLGIGRGDIVVNVLPTGSDAATASLCISSCATVAVLNPNLSQAEYASLFEELAPKLVLAHPSLAQSARGTAQAMRIPVIDVVAEAEAGVFTLQGDATSSTLSSTGQPAESGDTAYILTTSGSTARPKLVPLSHRILCSSVTDAGAAFELTPADRCLSFSPQFHSLGFNGNFLLPLANGSSTVCTEGFHVDDFFRWLDEFHPTWLLTVPAILREILEHSSRYATVIKRSSIRFFGASGAPLPRPVADKIEAVFGAPLLQVYGLSEAQNIALDRFSGGASA